MYKSLGNLGIMSEVEDPEESKVLMERLNANQRMDSDKAKQGHWKMAEDEQSRTSYCNLLFCHQAGLMPKRAHLLLSCGARRHKPRDLLHHLAPRLDALHLAGGPAADPLRCQPRGLAPVGRTAYPRCAHLLAAPAHPRSIKNRLIVLDVFDTGRTRGKADGPRRHFLGRLSIGSSASDRAAAGGETG